MRVLPLSLLAILCASGPLHAQDTLYTDSLNRFTIRMPASWTSRGLGDQGVIFYGPGLAIQVIPIKESGTPREVIPALMERINRAWSNLQEIDRQQMAIMGQATSWIVYNGTDFEGSPGTVRVMAVQGGGLTAGVIVNGERARYYAQRGTIEAILATLRLGTNPPSSFRTYASPPRDTTAKSDTSHTSVASPASLGLTLRDISGADLQGLNPANDEGVLVDRVEPGGPADQAGIRQDDVILQFDRTNVEEMRDVERLLSGHQVGDSVELQVERNGRKRMVNVRLGAAQ